MRNRCVCRVAFSTNGVTRVCALASVRGDDTRCVSGCHCLLTLLRRVGWFWPAVDKWKWMTSQKAQGKGSVTVKVAPGDWSRPTTAVGSVFCALALTLDVHGWTVRAIDKLQESWMDAWRLTLFSSGFFFFFEEGQRRSWEFPATTLFRSLFESVLNKGHQKLRYKATFWS